MLAELPVFLPGLPFDELTMPRYRGPLILILGGSAMLAVSLFLSLIMQDRRSNQGNPTHPGPTTNYPHHALRTPQRTASADIPADASLPTGASKPRGRTTEGRRQSGAGAVHPRATPPRPTRPAAQGLPGDGATLTTTRTRVRKRWLRTLKRTARRAGLGTPEHLVAPGGRHALQLRHCRTCMVSRGHVGCEQERLVLENALRHFEPRGRVVEVACDPQYGRCRFEILAGGR